MGRDEREAVRENFLGVEDGHIYFFYRPVKASANDLRDVEQLYIVMHPLVSKHYRLLSLETAKLPEPQTPFNLVTATVNKVDHKYQPILHELDEKTVTVDGIATMGKGAARPCGEGVYSLIPGENGMHLFYVVEYSGNDHQIVTQLGIGDDGEFLIGVYNPYYGTDIEDPDPDVRPRFPESLKSALGNERIVFKDVHLLLDYEEARVGLFREARESKPEEIRPIKEKMSTADIFSDLRLSREQYPVEPLIKGKWR
ncbi:hypothetical protein QA601_08920 [Chitinispirillales bacterium ANBcel5]|uniref:hypothetical protein n=1 Tax=Cellulosispirillum alkaliphilum TaxID=3039283 RepID=UPI002A52C263|nr:hypothetical protein [Chitinispirillales bacterium ANBcel5]